MVARAGIRTITARGVSLTFCLLSAVSAQNYSYNGGYALRVPEQCPDNAFECSVGYEARCCVTGQTCVTIGTNIDVCCPPFGLTATECAQLVIDGGKCADPSWSLCENYNGYWCCQEGYNCFTAEPDLGVGCQPVNQPLSPNQSQGTTIYAAFSGPADQIGSKSPTPAPTSTSTKSSSVVTATISSSPSTARSAGISAESIVQPSLSSTYTSTPSQISLEPAASSNLNPATASTSSHALSGGAIGGIVVGAVAVLALLFAAGWYIGRRIVTRGNGGAPQPLSQDNAAYPARRDELDGTPMSELDTSFPKQTRRSMFRPWPTSPHELP